MPPRNGNRKSREQISHSNRRTLNLGYYIIVTDTKETEENYLNGLRNSIPTNLKDNITIKVCKAKTEKLVEKALEYASKESQYREIWIVFDRDKVVKFDNLIEQAERSGIKVGWSNPCIEIWFSAYWGKMPTYHDSVACCSGFEKLFEQKTKQEYKKSDDNIYKFLCKYGDEEVAINFAKNRHKQHINSGNILPSTMNPCSTLYLLVDEIAQKTRQKGK